MKIRNFNFSSDYPEICEWWRGHGWPYVPKDHLPGYGFLAELEGIKCAAVWVYISNSSLAWMEWMTTNPSALLRPRTEAIGKLVEHLLREALHAGVGAVITSVRNENLIKLYQSKGFEVGDTGMTNLIARAGQ